MSNSFDKAFEHTVGLEGRYSDNPKDRGGKTKFGITEQTARAHGYLGDMKDMPLDVAKLIYEQSYWDAQRLGDIAAISEPVALELFDSGVNLGISIVGQFFQRSLNVLNHEGKDFADIPVDGSIGKVSVAAFREYMAHRGAKGERVMLRALNSLQGARYVELAEKREANEEFVFGWIDNRVAL